ncbi:helix-turn-helix domain-containing protein [Bacillus marasmi]|uniref:helix-turn-helix domain-containing protein n=1 Tax=Bacillus marasmi TaxID=1926279 RepID=UPI0011CA6A37|nr:helix-turn-helix domain-containing protein [Bacillus marasmi]
MKNSKKHTTWESLPCVLTAQHISEFLGISRRRVYELFQVQVSHGGIPSFQIGTSKRVDKNDFELWIKELKAKDNNLN